MTFLQPWALVFLPLIGLPLIIHLINQRRFQTVNWGAMMFLLSARELSRGYSRLRHWLIMLMRMLAVAAVIMAVGRPLSRGWLALAGGGRPDTAVVILDRSPSMQARDRQAADTKLDTGRRQLADAIATLGASRTLLFTDSARPPLELDDPAALADLPIAGPVAAPADIPRLLQAAYDHIRTNAAGTTELWICSDQMANDWAVDSGGWASLRDAFAALPQPVRFQLLAFPQAAVGNLAVRVTAARLERRGTQRDLLLSITVARTEESEAATVPVTIEIGGATSTVELDVKGREAVLAEHVIPLGAVAEPWGFGRVSIPADADAADNDFYFVFAEPPARRTLIVADDPAVARPLALVAGIAPNKSVEATADVVPVGGLATAAWEDAAVLLWQAPLPTGDDGKLLESFLDRGGQVVFFPPDEPDDREFAGCRWTEWTSHVESLAPETWRTDDDLLANTLSGAALPVGELVVVRSCGLSGEVVPLASLPGGLPLVARLPAEHGGIFFCTTTPAPRDSSLAAEGVVLYSLVQRSIDRGLESLLPVRQVDAGAAAAAVLGETGTGWDRLAGAADAPTDQPAMHAGVYRRTGDASAAGQGSLVAVNRPAAEDAARILPSDRVDGLFNGLSFTRREGRAGGFDSLVQEIWRAFLISMALALIAEGLLCLPDRRRSQAAAAPFGAAP